MNKELNEKLSNLLPQSTVFPVYAQELILEAYRTEQLSDEEAQHVIIVLKEEVAEIEKIDSMYAEEVERLKTVYSQ